MYLAASSPVTFYYLWKKWDGKIVVYFLFILDYNERFYENMWYAFRKDFMNILGVDGKSTLFLQRNPSISGEKH